MNENRYALPKYENTAYLNTFGEHHCTHLEKKHPQPLSAKSGKHLKWVAQKISIDVIL